MLSLFALRGALLFFKPLPLRGIGGDGHKMLRESRGDHRRLSLLTIFLHVRVTRTGIASGNCVQQSNARHYMRPFPYCQTQSTSCTLFSKKKNIIVGTKSSITHTILYAARSDCSATPQQQIMIYLLPPPYLKKRKCVSNPNNSTVASCV